MVLTPCCGFFCVSAWNDKCNQPIQTVVMIVNLRWALIWFCKFWGAAVQSRQVFHPVVTLLGPTPQLGLTWIERVLLSGSHLHQETSTSACPSNVPAVRLAAKTARLPPWDVASAVEPHDLKITTKIFVIHQFRPS